VYCFLSGIAPSSVQVWCFLAELTKGMWLILTAQVTTCRPTAEHWFSGLGRLKDCHWTAVPDCHENFTVLIVNDIFNSCAIRCNMFALRHSLLTWMNLTADSYIFHWHGSWSSDALHWEGNLKSAIALAMCLSLRFIHLPAYGLWNGNEHPAYTSHGV